MVQAENVEETSKHGVLGRKIDTLFFVPLFLVVCLVWMMSRSFRLFLITDAEIFDVLSALTEFVDLLSAQ